MPPNTYCTTSHRCADWDEGMVNGVDNQTLWTKLMGVMLNTVMSWARELMQSWSTNVLEAILRRRFRWIWQVLATGSALICCAMWKEPSRELCTQSRLRTTAYFSAPFTLG